MTQALLREFARRNRCRVTTAYDLALLSYVAMLRLSNRGRGTWAPLQDEWEIARSRAIDAAREGRCAPADMPVDVPVLLAPYEMLATRAEAVRDALSQASARRAYAIAHKLAPPPIDRIADLESERGLLVAHVADARPGRAVVVLRFGDGDPCAVRIR